MKKILVLLLICQMISPVYAIEYIQEWQDFSVPQNFNFYQEVVKKRKCTKLKLQKKLFKNKNKIKNISDLVTNDDILIQNCYMPKTFTDEELNITRWENYTVKKGFILSVELVKRGCSELYKKQIPHFHKKNNDIPPDVNFFTPGRVIKLQTCKEPEPEIITKGIDHKKKSERKSRFFKRMTNVSLGYNKDNDKDMMGVGLDLKINQFDLFITNTSESIVTQLKYNYFVNNYVTVFLNAGMRFSLENQEDLAENSFLQAGFAFKYGKNRLSVAQSLFAEEDSISAKLEHQFNDKYGIFGEILQWDTLKKESKGEMIFTGVQFFF